LDTQVHRLGSNNFAEIPINRPLAPVNNTQRDGFMAGTIPKGKANYYPNSLGEGYPQMATPETGEYVSYPEQVTGRIIRGKSPSFFDFYSQPAMFYHSQTIYEQQHIVGMYIILIFLGIQCWFIVVETAGCLSITEY
jgi:catalase